MAKITLPEEVAKLLQHVGMGVIPVENGRFDMPVKNIIAGDPFECGDIITIPFDYQDNILQVVLREGSAPFKFIMVDVKNYRTGIEKTTRFSPNQLAKWIYPVDEEGKRYPKVKTMGTAAAFYATFENVDDAKEALKGKRIVVRNKTLYRTESYGDRIIVDDYIYEYDFADNEVSPLPIKEEYGVLIFNEKNTCVIGVHNHSNVTKIFIPDNVYEIGKNALRECRNLRAIWLNKVHRIDQMALGDCSSLKRIDLPWTINSISANAFIGCSSLKEINVQSEEYHRPIEDYECDIPVRGYCSIDGILYSQYLDSKQHILTLIVVPQDHHSVHLVVPDNVVRIAHDAFHKCRNIQSVTFPSGIEYCPCDAFSGCESLEYIYIPQNTISRYEKLLPHFKHLLVEKE